MRGHLFGKPDTVGRAIEKITLLVHLLGIDREDDRFAAALAHLSGRLGVGGQVDVVAFAFEQSLFEDGGDTSRGRAVIEKSRRDLGL